jgi:arginine N-succinyltransferase
MFVIRPVVETDLDDLVELAKRTGGGLTTLPDNKDVLAERIDLSIKSFSNDFVAICEQYYFFVAEDIVKKRVVGTSAIFASVGNTTPFYNYKILNLMQVSKEPAIKVETQLLTLSNDYAGATELATLYLDPNYRSAGIGRALSKSRYLLMAAYPMRFSEIVMAEVRGWVDDNGQSPFWNAVGRNFFNMEFDEADKINGQGNNQFIGDLMPKFPIYTNLLPDLARSVIGKPHVNSDAALKLLEKEGFKLRGAVDIFDAGPIVEAHTQNIKSVANATRAIVSVVDELPDKRTSLVANPYLDNFRVVNIPIVLKDDNKAKILIDTASAKVLSVDTGMEVIYLPPENISDK